MRAAQPEDRVGTTLGGKYRLNRLLGAGGMGAVYDAENARTGRRVAIKVMLGAGAGDREWVERFQREARASTKIAHPNIVDVLDLGDDEATGSTYIVQEFLAGQDLRHLLDERLAVSPREALEILVPAMSALVAAHRQGVVHRDIKPDNIFLARGQGGVVTPKVIDFGIAKFTEVGTDNPGLTKTGAAMGTPYYMSPEQARGEKDIDAQTDVWAVGAMLFEMLGGRCPFEGDNYNAVMAKILTETAPRLDAIQPRVPRDLADVVATALQRDRAKRFRTMGMFLAKLLDLPAMSDDDWFRTLRNTHRGVVAIDDIGEGPTAEAQMPPPGERPIEPADRPEPTTTLGRSAKSIDRSTTRGRAGLRVVAALVAVGAGTFGIAMGMRSRRGAVPAQRAAAVLPATPPAPLLPAQPETFDIAMVVVPQVATIALDGVDAGSGALARALPRDGREHRIHIRADGYVEQLIVFRDAPPPERVELTALPRPASVARAASGRPTAAAHVQPQATTAIAPAVAVTPPDPPASPPPPRPPNGAPVLEQKG